MDLEVRCYGRIKQAVGERRLALQLDGIQTVGDLIDTLEESYDSFDRDALTGPAGLIIMRDRRHLDESDVVNDGDVISLSDSPMVES